MKRKLLLVLLLYVVGTDMAWPDLPGAFVFDPDESVESADGGGSSRETATMPLVECRRPCSMSFVVAESPRSELRRCARARREPADAPAPGAAYLPRAVCAFSFASEDPH